MYWRPWTQIVTCLPFGGVGAVVDADSTTPGFEFGGLMMPPSLTNVMTVMATRISAAATVQETSRRVLPWIRATAAVVAKTPRRRCQLPPSPRRRPARRPRSRVLWRPYPARRRLFAGARKAAGFYPPAAVSIATTQAMGLDPGHGANVYSRRFA